MIPLLALLLFTAPAEASGTDNLIRMMCMAAFDTAMQQAGKTPSQGMGDFTCDCFLEQIGEGEGIEASKLICKKKAEQQYSF